MQQSDQRALNRLFFISAIAVALLTLLGAAGESIGFDRKLKVNTVKTRTHSLLRQGMFYYKFLKNFTQDEHAKLLDTFNIFNTFNTFLENQSFWKGLFFEHLKMRGIHEGEYPYHIAINVENLIC